jgi:(p)ppGpp synthase/HD superfamily hydrolase
MSVGDDLHMRLGPRFDDALAFASRVHAGDRRKGTDVPYIAHPLSVCALVLLDGGGEDEAVAALLHDTLEDHPTLAPPEVIKGRFGEKVLQVVQECSDTGPDYAGGKKEDWDKRKRAYLAHIPKATAEARRVSLADKVDNAHAILNDYRIDGDELWKRFNRGKDAQLWYYRELVEHFRSTCADGFLFRELEKTVAELGRLVSAADEKG